MNEIIKRIIDQPIVSFYDVLYIVLGGMGLYYLRKVLDYYFYIPFAKRVGIKDPIGIKKFIENAWYVTYYPAMLILGYVVLTGKNFFPWKAHNFFPPPGKYYQDWIDFPEIKVYYMIQTAFYFQASASLIWELKRADFIQYCIHHAATISLLLFSYMAAQHRMGCNILFLHDISDIILYLTKILHYLDLYGGHKWADTLGRFCFVFFAISFYITRLFIYPKAIWNGTWAPDRWHHPGSMYFFRPDPGANANSFFYIDYDRMSMFDHSLSPQYLLLILMFVLVLLHLFWGFLILRMVLKFILGDLNQDIRSDPEDENNVEFDKVNKKKSNKLKSNGNGNGHQNDQDIKIESKNSNPKLTNNKNDNSKKSNNNNASKNTENKKKK